MWYLQILLKPSYFSAFVYILVHNGLRLFDSDLYVV